MSSTAGVPPVRDIPQVPTNAEQEIIFNFPWEAKAFALVVNLYQRGHYSWAEWAEQLSAEIKAAGAQDDGSKYYLLWLAAAEKLVAKKALAGTGEIHARKVALEVAQGGAAKQGEAHHTHDHDDHD